MVIYCHGPNRYGNMFSYIEDGVWYPFRFVNGGVHVSEPLKRGFYELEAEKIWFDKRPEKKKVGRAENVRSLEPTRINNIAEPRVPRRGE